MKLEINTLLKSLFVLPDRSALSHKQTAILTGVTLLVGLISLPLLCLPAIAAYRALVNHFTFINKKNEHPQSAILKTDHIAQETLSSKQTLQDKVLLTGKLSFSDLQKNELSYIDKLKLLKLASDKHKGIILTDVPGRSGQSGSLKMVIKEEPIRDESGQLLTQLSECMSYREALLKKEQMKHYSFEFYDLQKKPAPYPPSTGDGEIDQAVKASIDVENRKAAIKGRISEDGEIGELKSLNIHSEILSGNSLMKTWDQFCQFLSPKRIYLDDQAKIEGENGSYNLRLFRYFTDPNKASWYSDEYHYHPLVNGEILSKDLVREQIEIFRNEKIEDVQTFLSNFPTANEKERKNLMKLLKTLLEKHPEYRMMTFGEMVKELGARVLKGEQIHQDIHTLLTDYLMVIANYKPRDQEKIQEEFANKAEAAKFILNQIYFCKQYVDPVASQTSMQKLQSR